MDHDSPIVIGLAGEAGTGKTVTGKTIAPAGREIDMHNPPPLYWDHFVLATPLYALVTIKRKTEGEDARERKLHLIHQNLYEVFRSSKLPEYAKMVEEVEWIENYRLPNDPDEKPRTFLQDIGADMRDMQHDCFPQYLRQRIFTAFLDYQNEPQDSDAPLPPFAAIVSDVRYLNEVEIIKSLPNGLVIKLECDEEERQRRLYHRDGMLLSPSQASHHSETSLAEIPRELFDVVLDTTEMTVMQQAYAVNNIVEHS